MKNLGENHFRILGLRCFDNPNLDIEQRAKIKAMQKALFGKNDWIFFYEGITVSKDDKTVSLSGNFFDDLCLYNSESSGTEISISAIVGQNGSGKSSTIDMMIRVINNFATAIMGEKIAISGTEHLHYIENVYASLMVLLGNEIKIITIEDRNVSLDYYVLYKNNTFKYKDNWKLNLLIGVDCLSTPLDPIKDFGCWHLIDSLFYSIICNYSSYAYIYADYLGERTNERRLKAINPIIDIVNKPQETVWLNGLFHKNDGYQIPIVLNPMRQEGHINAVKEQGLAIERLLSMLYYRNNDYKENSYVDEFPFRRINSVLHITGMYLTFDESYKTKDNWDDIKLKIKADEELDYTRCRKVILDYFDNNMGISHNQVQYEKEARNYLVYKILKIAYSYDKYVNLRHALESISDEAIRKRLTELLKDPSHVTVKLWRTIFYLSVGNIYDEYVGATNCLRMEELDKWISKSVKKKLKTFVKPIENVLMPPPIFRVSFNIKKDGDEDAKKNDTYRKKPHQLWVMSSGERQIANVVSNIVYHLVNINSVHDGEVITPLSGKEILKYKYVNIVLDEIELYFHPELQRQFLFHVVNAFKNVTLENIKGVNIMLATHSPFILSDLPKTNVLKLENGNGGHPEDETLCANIMDMLSQSFFMDYSMGEISRNKVEWLFDVCCRVLEKQENIKLGKNDVCQLEYIASHIGDKYLKRKAEEKVKLLKFFMMTKDELKERKRHLVRELDDIEKRLTGENEDEKG